jgi:biotin-[acetyl-CoA-carboxylase] ligase BirA-like protein
MIVYTDSTEFANGMLPGVGEWATPSAGVAVRRLAHRLFDARPWHACGIATEFAWSHLFIVEAARRSQFDVLVEASRDDVPVPDRTLCLAGSGERFHGFRNRHWSAPRGNIYLSVFLSPPKDLHVSEAAFTALPAVSVVDAVDTLPGLVGRAGIKWVNDILVDGAKVCGVLTHVSREGGVPAGVILGIGLNVETTPDVEPTPYVPRASALYEFVSDPSECRREGVLTELLAALDRNYGAILFGDADALVERYRERSLVIGRRAVICAEHSGAEPEVLAEGRVLAMGEDLALSLEGVSKPVRSGRLILEGEYSLAGSQVHGA